MDSDPIFLKQWKAELQGDREVVLQKQKFYKDTMAKMHQKIQAHQATKRRKRIPRQRHSRKKSTTYVRKLKTCAKPESLTARNNCNAGRRNSWSISPNRNTGGAGAAANARNYASTSSICRPSAGRHAHISRI